MFKKYLCILGLFSTAIQAKSEPVFIYQSFQDIFYPVDISQTFLDKKLFNLEQGSITFQIRPKSEGLFSIFGVSNRYSHSEYLNFYLNRHNGDDTFGLEIKNKEQVIPAFALTTSIPQQEQHIYTITYNFDKSKDEIQLFVDGIKHKTYNGEPFFKSAKNLNQTYIGKTERVANWSDWTFNGEVYYVDITQTALTEKEILEKHQELAESKQLILQKKQENLKQFISQPTVLFEEGLNNANDYRIPALLTTQKGTLIAAIDKRNQHKWDSGNIDSAIRRSIDNGKTWLPLQTVIDLAEQPWNKNGKAHNPEKWVSAAAFVIDPLLVQDKKSQRIFMLLDMFPESSGYESIANKNSAGNGYKIINSKPYLILLDSQNREYTVREQGIIYDDKNHQTNYQMIINAETQNGFKQLGDLYQNQQRLGNVFLQNLYTQGKDTAPLRVKLTSYLWLTFSDNEGETWHNPIDLNPQIKADWMRFLGTGPGVGIQLKNGDLAMPIYFTNEFNRQSAALILSKDGGKTWQRGDSPNDFRFINQGGAKKIKHKKQEMTESQVIQLDSGTVKLFSRNHSGKVLISSSKDNGLTWEAVEEDNLLLDPSSQLSIIKLSQRINEKEYVVFANPSNAKKRENGTLYLGEVQADESIIWKYKTVIDAGEYGYNSLTELPNGQIGLVYEKRSQNAVNYVSIDLKNLIWESNK